MLRMKNTSIALREFFILRRPPARSQRVGRRWFAVPDTSGSQCLRAELPVQELRKCSGHPEPEKFAPDAGEVLGTVGGPADPRLAAPAAAAPFARAWIWK